VPYPWNVYAWAISAAVMVGALVAGAGRVWPGGSVGLLAVFVAVPAAIELAGRTVRHGSLWRQRRQRATVMEREESFASEPVQPDATVRAAPRFETLRVAATTDGRRLTADDWDALGTICGALSSAQIVWMASNTFITPWLDTRVRAALELEPLMSTLRERPFSAELRAHVGMFSDALTAFAAFYNDKTFPDPLLLGTDWRFFDWKDLTDAAQPGVFTAGLWNGRAAQLQRLSAAVSIAYESLREVATSEPPVRDRLPTKTSTHR